MPPTALSILNTLALLLALAIPALTVLRAWVRSLSLIDLALLALLVLLLEVPEALLLLLGLLSVLSTSFRRMRAILLAMARARVEVAQSVVGLPSTV